jgi:hypothetical protein
MVLGDDPVHERATREIRKQHRRSIKESFKHLLFSEQIQVALGLGPAEDVHFAPIEPGQETPI